jgi:DNA mismatch repair protein MutL
VIRLLDETTVGQIAAGEVVERPLSVVKELVENALDAGATRIAIAVTHGGLESIEVSDDGAGIAPGELPLAFARHATSKLSTASDLERVRTLGFRGEGLASIAAVARVRAISRTPSSDVGSTVDAHALDVSEVRPIAAPPGTRIVVRDLFANVPARREYLRSPAAEFARISSFVATLALGYPEVAFSLSHDGRPTFVFPAATDAAQRLAHVFGPEPARSLIPIAVDGAARTVPGVRGYVSTPGVDRADRRMQLLFVNGRLLRSTLLAGAWTSAYSSFALVGRQPFGVIFLEVAAEDVDPNVHPTKSDVRLRRPEAVHDAVRRAIAGTLAADAGERMRATMSFAPPGAGGSAPAYRAAPFAWNTGNDTANGNGNGHAQPEFATPLEPTLRVLAQLDATYILATDGNALVLVDQHAAHERIAFETIARRALAGKPVGEPLLIPYTVELDAADVSRFESSRDALVAAGLEAEPFGERAYRVVATPHALSTFVRTSRAWATTCPGSDRANASGHRLRATPSSAPATLWRSPKCRRSWNA